MFVESEFREFIESKIVNFKTRSNSLSITRLIDSIVQNKMSVGAYLNITSQSVSEQMKYRFKESIELKARNVTVRNYFLNQFGYKYCLYCEQHLSLSLFSHRNNRWDNKRDRCSSCEKEYKSDYQKGNKEYFSSFVMMREADKLKRTPSWANKEEILKLYREAKVLSNTTGEKYHVDHIIPLKGKYVSGLHVENNLQVVKANINQQKYNYHESEESWK